MTQCVLVLNSNTRPKQRQSYRLQQ